MLFFVLSQYSVVEEDDLLNSIQKVINEKNVPLFNEDNRFIHTFKSWTSQTGYPLLTVTRNYENESFTIHQEFFIGDNEQRSKLSNNNSLWWIPINFATATKPEFNILTPDFLMPPIRDFTVDEIITGREIFENDWLILNKQRTGYYCVNYDKKNWKLIINALKKNPYTIHPYNRVQLIQDAFNLFLCNHIESDIFFDLISYLKDEKETLVWASFLNIFFDFFKESQENSELEEFFQELIRPIFLKIGYDNKENDSRFMKYLRQRIIPIACGFNLVECTKGARNELYNIRKTGKDIPGQFTYCYGFYRSNDEEYEYFLNRMIWTECDDEREKLIFGLSCSSNQTQLKRLLNKIVSRETFPKYSLKEKLNLLKNFDKCRGIDVLLEFLPKFYEEYKILNSKSNHILSSKDPLRSFVIHISHYICNKEQEFQV